MSRHRAIIELARLFAGVACVAVICATVFGGEQWALFVGTMQLSVTLLILLSPHALLPLFVPGRWLFAGVVVVYAALATYLWHGYFDAVAVDPMNADNRGITGAILMFSNVAFVCGAVLRMAGMFVEAFLFRRSTREANAA